MSGPLIQVSLTGLPTELLEGIHHRMDDRATLHAEMAGTAEKFLKTEGFKKAAGEHRTADAMGAKRTGHLEDEYNKIEGTSNASAASLWIPGAGRLRAAFGTYTVRPGPGKSYLTIPVSPEAYGKRAAEVPGLVFMRVGPKKTPLLARPNGEGITTHYLLVKQSTIPSDASLLPLAAMAEDAALAAEQYILGGNDGNPATPS
jgi:hypothetical protein